MVYFMKKIYYNHDRRMVEMKKNIKLGIIIGAVLIVVVGLVLFFALRGKKKIDSSTEGITFKYIEHECRGNCKDYNYFITLEVYKDNVLIPYTEEFVVGYEKNKGNPENAVRKPDIELIKSDKTYYAIIIYQDGLDKNINPYPTVINEKGDIVYVPDNMDKTNKFKLTNMTATTYKIGNKQYRIDKDTLYYFVSDGCDLLNIEQVLIYGDLGKVQEITVAKDSYEVISGKWCNKDI